MGTVYLIKSRNLYKIGATDHRSAATRLAALSVGSPTALRLIHEIPNETPYALERLLHQRFEDKRVRGEWFRLCPADVKWVKEFVLPLAPVAPAVSAPKYKPDGDAVTISEAAKRIKRTPAALYGAARKGNLKTSEAYGIRVVSMAEALRYKRETRAGRKATNGRGKK
jgi:hypothetical protein